MKKITINDEVRDDIEAWIKKSWKNEPLKQKVALSVCKGSSIICFS